jgi:hypothetical protein
MLTIQELNAKLAGSRGIQVCFGENETIIRMDNGLGISIERDISVDRGRGSKQARPTDIITVCLTSFISLSEHGSQFTITFERGNLRFVIPDGPYESVVIFDRNPSNALFVK